MSKRSVLPALLAMACALTGPSIAAAAPAASLIYTQYAATPMGDGTKDYVVSGDLHTIDLNGTAGPSLFATDASESHPAVSANGHRLAFVRDNAIVVGNADGTRQRVMPAPSGGANDMPTFAPDGHTVVFSNDETGLIAVDSTAAHPKARTLVKTRWSARGVTMYLQPQFAPSAELRSTTDRKRLYYLRARFTTGANGNVSRVATSVDSANADGTHRAAGFSGVHGATILGYSISPDGTRAAYVASSPTWKHEPRHLQLLSLADDWIKELATADRANHSSFGMPTWSPDGTTLAVPQNASDPARGGQIDLIDGETGRRTVLTRIANGRLDEPVWLPAR